MNKDLTACLRDMDIIKCDYFSYKANTCCSLDIFQIWSKIKPYIFKRGGINAIDNFGGMRKTSLKSVTEIGYIMLNNDLLQTNPPQSGSFLSLL